MEPVDVLQSPKEHMRIEEKPQYPGSSGGKIGPSSISRINSSSGSKASGAIQISPFIDPTQLGKDRLSNGVDRSSTPVADEVTGVSRTAGLPARAMMISSPFSARSINFERPVLAAWTLTIN